MLMTALYIAFALISLALLLTVISLARGPSIPDRVLGLDTLYINSIALIILYGIAEASTIHFEAALLIAMLGFVSTAALCKYMLRGDIIE
ncbi:MAG TPA: K+/H+ antiporter subunit F [Marinobacterium sp.]|nr:K+/H+ antiporter subunit F [Marinobacterium sp.]